MIPVAGTGGPIVMAHRGGGDEAPENSMEAFERMRGIGVRNLETDAHVTADGVVVLHHDPMVDRTYDGTGLISRLTWREISRMRNAAGERMPLLAEVLDACPDMWLNIDAKSDDVVDPLMGVLEEHDAFGRVLLASFSEQRLRRIRRSGAPDLSTSLGVDAVARLVAAAQFASNPASWRVPGPRQSVRAVQVPERYGVARVVTPRFVATAHWLGLAVHVWTVNEARAMARLADMGVDGIITDRPTLLKELLVARGQWNEEPTPDEV